MEKQKIKMKDGSLECPPNLAKLVIRRFLKLEDTPIMDALTYLAQLAR